ncbi:MAG: M14 family zinc carboxypeptidase [Salinisphaeraceae bacterium]
MSSQRRNGGHRAAALVGATLLALTACSRDAAFERQAPDVSVTEAPPVTLPHERSGLAFDKAHPEPARVTIDAAAALADWCTALADRLHSVARADCASGFELTGHESVHGRPITVRPVPASARTPRGRVLLIGGTHGDELTSVSLVFWWLSWLEATGSAYHWRIIPAMNPDGLFARPAQRVNANGVDLNRNLPTPGWETASRDYWRDTGRSERRFPGDAAASEPETRWLVDEIEHYRPDVIVTLHAPYGVLDYDGEPAPPPRLGPLELNRLGVFPGSLGNYGARYLDIPVVTVELTHATRMPAADQARAMLRDLTRWLDSSIAPHVRQAQRRREERASGG